MLSRASFLYLGLFAYSASALAFNNAPAIATVVPQTKGIGVSPHGSIPYPTPAPDSQELRRRQAASQRTLLAGPDNTCGYYGGNSSLPWGCSQGSECVFATASATVVSNITSTAAASVLCCDPKTGCPTSPSPTACVDRGRYEYNTSCTGTCPQDTMTLKWYLILTPTSGIYLYCNTISFSAPSVSAIFCNYISTYDALAAETGIGRAFTPTVQTIAASTSSSSSSSSTSASVTAKTSSSQPSATAASASSSGGKKVNKKAIIGGTIGGVVGLALIIGLVILFLRWRNTPEGKPEPETETATPANEAAEVQPSKGKEAVKPTVTPPK